MWVEPNAFLPWDIYLDWIYEFNDNEDFRDIPIESLISHLDDYLSSHETNDEENFGLPGSFQGFGDGSEDSYYSYFMFRHGDGELCNFLNQGHGGGNVNCSMNFFDRPPIVGSYGDSGLETRYVTQFLGCGG